jgi:hypothetical protein
VIPSDIRAGALEVPRMGRIGSPCSYIMEYYFWDLEHKLCPLKTPPAVRVVGGPEGGHFGGLVGPRIVRYQLINTLGLV